MLGLLEEAFLRRSTLVLNLGDGSREEGWRLMFGSTNLFCLLGGRISSRSTGTPRDTRKRRRMRERVQFGGAMGGGCRSCCQRESERSERKGVPGTSEGGVMGGVGGASVGLGKMAAK